MRKSLFIPSWETINKKHLYQFEYFSKFFTNIFIITTNNYTDLSKINKNNNIEIFLKNNFFYRLIKYISFLIKNKNTDNYAILSPYGLSSILFFMISKIFYLKIISVEWGVIDLYEKKTFLERLFVNIIFKNSKAIWFKEPYMKKKLEKFKNQNLFFINNSIKPLPFFKNKEIDQRSVDFLWVNRFADSRTPEVPIKALLKLKERYRFRAVFLGDIDDKFSYLNQYEEFKIYNYKDPIKFYNKSRFFIGSGARYFGNNALIEAMNHGLIPIVNESEDIEKIIDNNINGFLCQNNFDSFLNLFVLCLNMNKKNIDKLSFQANRKISISFSHIEWEKKMNNLLSNL